jgi:hypothetical protein
MDGRETIFGGIATAKEMDEKEDTFTVKSKESKVPDLESPDLLVHLHSELLGYIEKPVKR